jgi:predicted 2-oxoglutarate/Fe(II)-dependent dioxygenase YbiX
MNRRLSFLRYGPGHYFKPHCDGLVDVPNNGIEQKSFVTLHLYLNDDGLQGGATRFWTPDKKHWLDVHPKAGRVLIFQQRMLVHSGEGVTKGVKYTMRSDLLFEQVDER